MVSEEFLGLAGSICKPEVISSILEKSLVLNGTQFTGWQATGLSALMEALSRRDLPWQSLPGKTAVDLVQKSLTHARKAASDESAATDVRLRSIPLLGCERSQQAGDFVILGKLLQPNQPLPLQTAAIERLGSLANDQVGEIVLASWRGFSPDIRNQALDLLLSRPAWRGQLLEAIDKKQVLAGDVDTKRRQVLLELRDKTQKALAGQSLRRVAVRRIARR